MSRSRNTVADLAWVLDDSETPLYVLDDRRRIIFCNAACARLLGVPAEELAGQTCNYHTADGSDPLAAIAASLCPPPEVFAGQSRSAVLSVVNSMGTLLQRRAQFWPLSGGEDESSPVVALLETQDYQAEPEHDAASRAPSADELHAFVRRFRRQMASRFTNDILVGPSPAAARLRAQIDLAAGSQVSVLLLGPAGAGKERLGKAIHYRQAEPGLLLPLEFGLLEANVLRSTLRTLAQKRLEPGEPRGTVLLLDVDRATPDVQIELLAMMHTGVPAMRVIATTELPFSTKSEEFSGELAAALSTLCIDVTPLGERLEDLSPLAQWLLEEQNASGNKQVGGFSIDALEQLALYTWPGDVDELAEIVRQAHERSSGGQISPRDLPAVIQQALGAASHPKRADESIMLEEFLARVEKELITRAMRRAKGNKSKAAKLLGLTRPRLYRRLVQLGLEPGQARAE